MSDYITSHSLPGTSCGIIHSLGCDCWNSMHMVVLIAFSVSLFMSVQYCDSFASIHVFSKPRWLMWRWSGVCCFSTSIIIIILFFHGYFVICIAHFWMSSIVSYPVWPLPVVGQPLMMYLISFCRYLSVRVGSCMLWINMHVSMPVTTPMASTLSFMPLYFFILIFYMVLSL